MTEEKNKSLHPISLTLCETYRGLCEQEHIPFLLLDKQIENLDSIVKTVYSSYFGAPRFLTDHDKAVAFFYFIIKDHPVTDGNKRLAVLWLQFFCSTIPISISEVFIELDVLAVLVEKSPSEIQMDVLRLLKKMIF